MKSRHIDQSRMIRVEDVLDEDPEETKLLKERAEEAQRFMRSFKWCRSIKKHYFAGGFSHVAVFLLEIDNTSHPDDEYLWVVVGDLPPAYLVVDAIPDYKEALLVYAYEMRQWVEAVRNGRSTEGCIPVYVEPTLENALMLESRLDFIENDYVPSLP